MDSNIHYISYFVCLLKSQTKLLLLLFRKYASCLSQLLMTCSLRAVKIQFKIHSNFGKKQKQKLITLKKPTIMSVLSKSESFTCINSMLEKINDIPFKRSISSLSFENPSKYRRNFVLIYWPTFALLEFGQLCHTQLIITRHAFVVSSFLWPRSQLPSASPAFCNELRWVIPHIHT